ncbi:MAG: class I SAM-dependent methyltransferase [Chloroherpetonaceae bacterium]|nr:class I SAM-dependent methyltransferase [Chloroherpetonaceae bacterium]MCS7211313.1 class I SAM-dependent methyltransferase [Chloroherpetonaceae bacterium]MDW8020290.1 class I SAM-dependent methyltransferase [Chloroherpetonaceae bacterium]MDW8466516.1 class I SAM-dependent methyltransferase [Chloroherpetonaceae bacterium]
MPSTSPAAEYTAMSFKDIATSYNKINAIPEKAALQIGKVIAHLAGKHSKLLDVGAGAGRITIPIAIAGCEVTALDCEPKMLEELERQVREFSLHITTVVGDAAKLPFADNTFDAVFTSNVLHLVPQWEKALDEAIRVMKFGGVFIQGRDWVSPDSAFARLRNKLREIVATLNPNLKPTAAAGPALFEALSARGGKNEPEIIAARWTQTISPAKLLMQMENRAFNETWQLEEGLLREAMGRIRTWAREQWHNLEREEETEFRFLLYLTRGLRRQK